MVNDEFIEKVNEELEKIKEEELKRLEDLEDEKEEEEREIIVDRLSGDTKRIEAIETLEDENDESISKDKKSISEEKNEAIEKSSGNDDKNKKKKKIIITVILLIIALLIIVVVIWLLFFNKKESREVDKEEKLSKAEQQEIIDNYGEAIEGIIAVYYDKQKVLLEYDHAIKLVDFSESVVCKTHEIYEDGLVYLDKCTINDEKTKCSYGEKQEPKEEPEEAKGAIKVYVNKSSKEAILTEPKVVDNYDVYSFNIEGAYSELTLLRTRNNPYIFYYDQDYNVQMINFKTNEKALKGINYDAILPIKDGNNFETNFVAVKKNDKWGIYNLNTGNCIVYPRYDFIAPNLAMGTSGPPLYAEALETSKVAVIYNGSMGVIDYTNGEEVIQIIYNGMLKSGNYLFATDSKNNGHILDYDGNEYLNNFNKVYGFIDGKYALVNDKSTIKLVGLNGKLIYNYGEIDLGEYNFGLPYNGGALFQFSKNNNDYENCIEVIYDSSTKKGEVKNSSCGGIAKPVLYLYPKKKTDVTVSFEHPEYLETTYPKFTGSWQVKADTNGDLLDKYGKYYYALYWDEAKVHSVDFSRGYYVEAANAINFLEQKLTYIGLSKKEMNEFIMYWLPVLEKNKKSLVYFELTEERESYNKIYISPKPDSLLRLTIHIKKVNKKVNIRKQNLTKFQRKGFVAVEWGGTTY